MPHFVIPVILCNHFLSDFMRSILKFVMLSLFVTFCNKFFSEILKERMLGLLLTFCNNNWNCKELRSNPDFCCLIFKKLSREEETTVNWYVIVTWLLWKFSIFKNPIGKTLIRKYHPNFFSFSENSIYAWRVKHYQYFVNHSIQIFKFEHFSTLFEQVWSKKPKLFGSDEVWHID